MRFLQHFREAPGIVSFSSSNGLFLMELVLNTVLPLQSFGVQPLAALSCGCFNLGGCTERRLSSFELNSLKMCSAGPWWIKKKDFFSKLLPVLLFLRQRTFNKQASVWSAANCCTQTFLTFKQQRWSHAAFNYVWLSFTPMSNSARCHHSH